jgi:hypothetical protein
VKVRPGEGTANHTGLEHCVSIRVGEGKASVGEFTGQPSSRVRMEPGRRRCCEGRRQKAKRLDARSQVSRLPYESRSIPQGTLARLASIWIEAVLDRSGANNDLTFSTPWNSRPAIKLISLQY